MHCFCAKSDGVSCVFKLTLTRDMEPNQPCQGPRGKYNLGPVPSSLVVPLETRCRSVGNYETEDGTEAAGRWVSLCQDEKERALQRTL